MKNTIPNNYPIGEGNGGSVSKAIHQMWLVASMRDREALVRRESPALNA